MSGGYGMRRMDRNKALSRGVSRDMSPKAIERRLDIVSELRAFSQFPATAKRVRGNADAEGQPPNAPEHPADADPR